jgi:hypothetical protein
MSVSALFVSSTRNAMLPSEPIVNPIDAIRSLSETGAGVCAPAATPFLYLGITDRYQQRLRRPVAARVTTVGIGFHGVSCWRGEAIEIRGRQNGSLSQLRTSSSAGRTLQSFGDECVTDIDDQRVLKSVILLTLLDLARRTGRFPQLGDPYGLISSPPDSLRRRSASVRTTS